MDIRYKTISGFKLIFVLFSLSIFLAFFIVTPVLAAADDRPWEGTTPPPPSTTGLGNAFNTGANSPLNAVAVQGAGYNTTATFVTIISTVLTMVLGLLGIIFLILGIYGGYNWMMARGNEDMVGKAKQTITNAVIGLIVVLAAYAISRFIIEVVGSKVFK